jgi:hypothetical protein
MTFVWWLDGLPIHLRILFFTEDVWVGHGSQYVQIIVNTVSPFSWCMLLFFLLPDDVFLVTISNHFHDILNVQNLCSMTLFFGKLMLLCLPAKLFVCQLMLLFFPTSFGYQLFIRWCLFRYSFPTFWVIVD